jgi:hypothetical protein
MNKNRSIELRRAILEIENPFPKDDLIITYKDFLESRDYLCNYKFNSNVFDRLVNLALENWTTKHRINRLSLLQKIKQYFCLNKSNEYYNQIIKPSIPLKIEVRKNLFKLFWKTFEESKFIPNRQLNNVRKICNYLLINLELTSEEEEWLSCNISKSELILNRLLRYPIKSEIISKFIKENFHNDILRSRRAETISWIIDIDPSFEIDRQVLIDDFEFLNQSDLQAIQNYQEEREVNKIIEQEFGDYLSKKSYYNYSENSYQDVSNLSVSELKFSKRHYKVPTEDSTFYPINIPDFEKLRDDFYSNLSKHQMLTMIWAIGYSRQSNKMKYSLLKKYYCKETYYSLFRVCQKSKNIELLKWLLDNHSV